MHGLRHQFLRPLRRAPSEAKVSGGARGAVAGGGAKEGHHQSAEADHVRAASGAGAVSLLFVLLPGRVR